MKCILNQLFSNSILFFSIFFFSLWSSYVMLTFFYPVGRKLSRLKPFFIAFHRNRLFVYVFDLFLSSCLLPRYVVSLPVTLLISFFLLSHIITLVGKKTWLDYHSSIKILFRYTWFNNLVYTKQVYTV